MTPKIDSPQEALLTLRSVLSHTRDAMVTEAEKDEWQDIGDLTKGTVMGVELAIVTIDALLKALTGVVPDSNNLNVPDLLAGMSEFLRPKQEPGTS